MIKIFMAKKEEDQIRAKRIREILDPYLGAAARIYLSQDVPKGTKWRDWIRAQLKETDLLLFLFSGPSKDWQWCLYEVGLFTSLEAAEAQKPIVCIHPPGTQPPDPIDDLQSVPCDVETLTEFLRRLFRGDVVEKAINPPVAADEPLLIEIAEKIYGEWVQHDIEEERVYYTRYISLALGGMLPDDAVDLPEDVTVEGDRLSLEIFGLVKPPGGTPRTLEQFRPYLRETAEAAGDPDPDELLAEFETAILKSCKHEMITPSERRIQSLSSGKQYQPVVHRRDIYPDGRLKVRVLFVQISEPEGGPRNLTSPAPPGE